MKREDFYILFTVVAVFLTLIVLTPAVDSRWEAVIIERGYGMYCPTDGDFAFIGECDTNQEEIK